MYTLGHAFGTLLALPLDVPVLLLMAAGAVTLTAAALTRRDATSQSPARRRVRKGPSLTPAQRRVRRAVARGAGILGLIMLLVLAVIGGADPARNPLPRTLLILFWGGLVPASLLFGEFYRAVNPLRSIAAAVARVTQVRQRGLPDRIGRWPGVFAAAAIIIGAMVGLDAPGWITLGLFAYAILQVTLGVVYGQRWFAAADAPEVLNSIVGSVAVFGRTGSGGFTLRDPVVAAAKAPTPPGTIAFVAVLVGSAWFESLAEAAGVAGGWSFSMGMAASWVTAALVLRMGAVRDFLVPALLPLAGAYGMLLFTSPLLLEGQIALSQIAALLSGTEAVPSQAPSGARLPVPEVWLAAFQYVVFVSLHAMAILIAHRGALARFDLRGARAVQFPLRAVLLGSVIVGLWLPTLG